MLEISIWHNLIYRTRVRVDLLSISDASTWKAYDLKLAAYTKIFYGIFHVQSMLRNWYVDVLTLEKYPTRLITTTVVPGEQWIWNERQRDLLLFKLKLKRIFVEECFVGDKRNSSLITRRQIYAKPLQAFGMPCCCTKRSFDSGTINN